MPVEVKKQSGETSYSLVRRFTQSVQKSGVLIRARQYMFRRREKSDQLRKKAALRREELREEYEKAKKMGK
jgi:ribosomal protein S21